MIFIQRQIQTIAFSFENSKVLYQDQYMNEAESFLYLCSL